MRRLLARNVKLLGGESAYSDHADLAAAPRLPRNPFDEVKAIPIPRAPVIGLEMTSRLGNHLHTTAANKVISPASM